MIEQDDPEEDVLSSSRKPPQPKDFFEELQELESALDKTEVSEEPESFQWDDLNESSRQEVENEGEFMLQNKVVKLHHLLPENQTTRNELLGHLSGSPQLGYLLQQEVPQLFAKQELPSTSVIYLERHLSRRIIVEAPCLLKACVSDLFFVTNISMESLKQVVSPDIPVIDYFSSNGNSWNMQSSSKPKLVLLKGELQECLQEFSELEVCVGNFHSSNVHLLYYLQGNLFEWLATQSPTAVLENERSNVLYGVRQLNENAFLQALEMSWGSGNRLHFIADKNGTGKSQVLRALAKKMGELWADRCIVFSSMNEFVGKLEEVESSELSRESVVAALIDLICSNDFERKLVEYWLTFNEGASRKLKFEILLDGLGEVSGDNSRRELAISVLKIFQDHLPSVRVWVTLRDDILERVRTEFWESGAGLGYKMEPFSEPQQTDYLVLYFQSKLRLQLKYQNSQVLASFARKCVKILPMLGREREITGIPLLCRMLAEIYEEKVLASDFATFTEIHHHSLMELYEKFIERKLRDYLKEKLYFGNVNVEMVREKMDRFHTYFAMQLIFSQDVANKFANRLILAQWHELSGTVRQQGLIETMHPLTFIHRSVAEYFLARFVYKVLTGQWSQKSIPVDDPDFEQFLATQVLLINAEGKFQFPTLCHILNELGSSHGDNLKREDWKCLMDILRDSTESSQPEMVSPLIAAYKAEFDNLIVLLLNSKKYVAEIFARALLIKRYDFVEQCILGNTETDFVTFQPQRWDALQDLDKSKQGFGILHWLIEGLSNSSNDHSPSPDDVASAIKLASLIVEKDKSVLEQKDAEGRTPLVFLLSKTRHSTNAESIADLKKLCTFFVTELRK